MRTKIERLDAVHVPIGFAGHILSLPSTKHCGDPLSVINLRKRLSAAGVLRSRLGGVGSPSCHVTKLACSRPNDVQASQGPRRSPAAPMHTTWG